MNCIGKSGVMAHVMAQMSQSWISRESWAEILVRLPSVRVP